MSSLLTFGNGNAKLAKGIYTFSLPAGYTCPGASACLAFANRETGKITDGSNQQFRCFSASGEAVFPAVRKSRWHNYNRLLDASTREGMANLILASLTVHAATVRIHVSGDFFSPAYFLAWCDVAKARPRTVFYAYTKSLHIVKAHGAEMPENLRITASIGGKFDSLAGEFKTAQVVRTEEEAAALGLEIDHDDSHAYEGDKPFALLIHGTQPKRKLAAA